MGTMQYSLYYRVLLRFGLTTEGPNTLGHQHRPVAPIQHKSIEDPFFFWLKSGNPGHYQDGNTYCFDYAIKNLPGDYPMIEIGTFAGLSTNAITHCKRRHAKKNKLFTCDKWLFVNINQDKQISSSPLHHRDYGRFIRETYIRNARFFSSDDLPATIELFSDDFFAAWASNATMQDVFDQTQTLGGPISFAFIDGNHAYDFAKRDFLNVDKFLVSRGFILFDDSNRNGRDINGKPWEVCRVVDEALETGRYEVVIRNPNYLLIKK